MWRVPKPDPVYFYLSSEAKAGHLDAYGPEWHRRFAGYVARGDSRASAGAATLGFGRARVLLPADGMGHSYPMCIRAPLTNTLIYFPSDENTAEQGTLLYRRKSGLKLQDQERDRPIRQQALEPP